MKRTFSTIGRGRQIQIKSRKIEFDPKIGTLLNKESNGIWPLILCFITVIIFSIFPKFDHLKLQTWVPWYRFPENDLRRDFLRDCRTWSLCSCDFRRTTDSRSPRPPPWCRRTDPDRAWGWSWCRRARARARASCCSRSGSTAATSAFRTGAAGGTSSWRISTASWRRLKKVFLGTVVKITMNVNTFLSKSIWHFKGR